jgi:hypothetical protein
LIEKTPIDTPDNEEEDVSAEEEEYLEEEDDDHVDSEKSLPKKSCTFLYLHLDPFVLF